MRPGDEDDTEEQGPGWPTHSVEGGYAAVLARAWNKLGHILHGNTMAGSILVPDRGTGARGSGAAGPGQPRTLSSTYQEVESVKTPVFYQQQFTTTKHPIWSPSFCRGETATFEKS